MEVTTSTRARLVTAMAEMLRAAGYTAASVKNATVAAGVPTGSLYHHFPGGKRELAAEALRTSGGAYLDLLHGLLEPYDDAATALRAAFDSAAEVIEASGWINMCPVVTVAGEVADAEPGLRAVTAEIIGGWIDASEVHFARQGVADARELALAVASALEGAFILARTLRSAEPIRAAGRAVAGYAATLSADAPRQARSKTATEAAGAS